MNTPFKWCVFLVFLVLYFTPEEARLSETTKNARSVQNVVKGDCYTVLKCAAVFLNDTDFKWAAWWLNKTAVILTDSQVIFSDQQQNCSRCMLAGNNSYVSEIIHKCCSSQVLINNGNGQWIQNHAGRQDNIDGHGNPGPRGKFIGRDIHAEFRQTGRQHTLTIIAPVLLDEGRYWCVVQKRNLGEFKNSTYLDLVVIPDKPSGILNEQREIISKTLCKDVEYIPTLRFSSKVFICSVDYVRPQPTAFWEILVDGRTDIKAQEFQKKIYHGATVTTVDRQLDITPASSGLIKCIVKEPNAVTGKAITKHICLRVEKVTESGGLSPLEIAGIVIGVLVFLGILSYAICGKNSKVSP